MAGNNIDEMVESTSEVVDAIEDAKSEADDHQENSISARQLVVDQL